MSENPPSGKPSYGSAQRVAQVVHLLHQNPLGVSMSLLERELRVHRRTLSRYIQTLQEALMDDDGEPLVEYVRKGGEARLRFRRKRTALLEGEAYELMSLYLALDLMTFLDGTFLHEGAEEILDRLQGMLSKTAGHQTNLILKDFDKKFHHFTEAPKDYSGHNDILRKLVQALVVQRFIQLSYQKHVQAEPRRHRVQPLTLLMYKRALYLVCRRPADPELNKEERILTFAVERITSVTVLEEGFPYPADYDPEGRYRSNFGLVADADPVEVVLRFDKVVAGGVSTRHWHPSQSAVFMENGDLEMRLNVSPGAEFLAWILGYGAFVEVMEPLSLRDQVRERLQEALLRYQ